MCKLQVLLFWMFYCILLFWDWFQFFLLGGKCIYHELECLWVNHSMDWHFWMLMLTFLVCLVDLKNRRINKKGWTMERKWYLISNNICINKDNPNNRFGYLILLLFGSNLEQIQISKIQECYYSLSSLGTFFL